MKHYAVIGHPVAHSLSPVIHAQFGRRTGVPLRYDKLEVGQHEFQRGIEGFIAAGGSGANVTVPFKEAAYGWVTHRDHWATAAGAVNTIVRRGDTWVGHNTDGVGLVRDLRSKRVMLAGARVLLVGAGGAARGVVLPLLQAGVAEVLIANRTLARASDLMARFADQVGGGTHPRLGSVDLERARTSAPFDLVINATSAGLSGQELPLFPRHPGTVYYDMMYGEKAAFFLSAPKDLAAAFDGLGMLVQQAAEAFRLWHGVFPDAAGTLAALETEDGRRT